MPPPSIQRFTRFLLASVALAAGLTALNFAELKAALIRQDPATGSLGDSVLVLALGLGLGVMVLLWFLIAQRGSNLAKWVLVAVVGLGILLQLPALGAFVSRPDAMSALSLLSMAGQVFAVLQLFRADAVQWLSQETPVADADIG